MARPLKEGLSYFPLDVDFDVNEKTEAIMGEFGTKGTLIFIYLLLAIYRKGYFLQWNGLVKNQVANRVKGTSGELVEQVVSRLIEYGTFNKELFNSAKVLTSQRIQDTYLDATKRRKAAKPTLYWIDDSNNVSSSGVNVDINPQSKGNKSKVNKSKTHEPSVRAESQSVDADIRKTFTTEIWPLFGKKTKFEGAYQAYYQDLLEGATNKQIIVALKNLAEYYRINETQQRYMINPQAYFEERRYTDKLDLTPPVKKGRNGQPARQETLPDWAKDDYQAPKQQVSAERKAALKERMARLQADKTDKSEVTP